MSYSFSLTTFDPSGKLVQIEYALKAVSKGQTSVGIRATNGTILITEKVLPSGLIVGDSIQKIAEISPGIGMVYSGIGPDFQVLVRRARKKAMVYTASYNEAIPVHLLVSDLASVMQEFTQSGGVRPFGCSVLVAGYDYNGAHLYQIDPSGSFFNWKATSIGKNFIHAKTFLEKRYRPDMELEDAIHTSLLTLKEGFEGEMTCKNIEMAKVGDDGKFHRFTEEEIQDYLDEAE